MEPSLFASLLESVREADKFLRWLRPWWQFNTPAMDYTQSPDWYAGAV
jgi:hypothetical protein